MVTLNLYEVPEEVKAALTTQKARVPPVTEEEKHEIPPPVPERPALPDLTEEQTNILRGAEEAI